MNNDKTLPWGGLIYDLFVTTAVYWLGAYLEISAGAPVKVAFAIGVGALASLVFLAA